MRADELNPNDILRFNKSQWEKIPIHNMHADTNLIRCKKKYFDDSQGRKLIDIGFGEGQNLIYFLEEGFDCYGTEIAQSRFNYLNIKLKVKNLKAELRLVESNELPFDDKFFDVVVAWESICYNDEKGLRTYLGEIYRVLKRGGIFVSSLPSPEHRLCGKEIAPSVFRPLNTPDQSQCVLYALKSEEQVIEFYNQFEDVKIGSYCFRIGDNQSVNYMIICKKSADG